GGKVQSFDATATKAIKGVKNVVQVSNGVVMVADNFWTALQGRKALKVTWDEGPIAQVSSASITREYEAASKQPGQVARNEGDVEGRRRAREGRVDTRGRHHPRLLSPGDAQRLPGGARRQWHAVGVVHADHRARHPDPEGPGAGGHDRRGRRRGGP